MYARQSEIFEDEECKSEGGTQRGLFIRAKKRINDSNNFGGVGGGGARKPTKPHLLPHMPLWFTNCQILMTAERTVRYNAPFEGALMGSSTAQYPPVELLGKPLPLEFLDSSLRTRHESKGAIVRPCDIQIHLGLGLQPNNMAHSVPKPRP